MPNEHPHLDIAPIVAELHALRVRSLELRQRESHPPKLPSRTVLREIVEGLATVLYPNRLGTGDQTDEGIDFFVGHTLDATLRKLVVQIQRELRFAAEQAGDLNPDGDLIQRRDEDIGLHHQWRGRWQLDGVDRALGTGIRRWQQWPRRSRNDHTGRLPTVGM